MATVAEPVGRRAGIDAALEIGRLAGSLDADRLGGEMHALVRELYPVCRSITGEGLRLSLRTLGRLAPLELHEVPSGTQVFDWVVPKEWNLRAARLTAPDGTVIADADRLNLHVLNYSVPFRGKVPLEELQRHLHSIPEKPDLVPYRTSYYKEEWGFCLAHRDRARLSPGSYEVLIDTTLASGSLTYGELALPGASADEVLVSVHCCHPSLANDNLSGMALAATLARLLNGLPLRYTYRFVFAPGTIGAITWLARNEHRTARIRHGLVVACVGDGGHLHYKRSRRGDAEIDRAVAHVLRHGGEPYELRDFTPYGYDERQYCSPGFDLPVGSLTRTPHGEYPEYHTSGDDPALVKPDRLVHSLRAYLAVLQILEGNRRYLNLSPRCEPQLGKRGLYGTIGGQSHAAADQTSMLWVLNQSDGRKSLLDVAERAQLPFPDVYAAARALEAAGLLAEYAPANGVVDAAGDAREGSTP
jgi:aminopeptidase-like protein